MLSWVRFGLMKWKIAVALAALLACLFSPISSSQESRGLGAVSGIVSELGTAAVVPSVRVTLRSIESGGEHTAVSDEEGRFTIMAVAPGSYALTAERDGFF